MQNNLHFAFRQLLKTPGFTVVAVISLALGLGVNTMMFLLWLGRASPSRRAGGK